MSLKHFAVKSIFTKDYYDLEWYNIPKGIQDVLQKISNDVFNDNFWSYVPKYIREMIDLDNLSDETDNYKLYVDDGEFIWCSNFIRYYLDINQWMLLDAKMKEKYEYKTSDSYFSCELVIKISNIYEEPTISNIELDISMDGDVESFGIYPRCNLKYPMTKEEIIEKFGNVYEEDDDE